MVSGVGRNDRQRLPLLNEQSDATRLGGIRDLSCEMAYEVSMYYWLTTISMNVHANNGFDCHDDHELASARASEGFRRRGLVPVMG